jgi:hypothetical protein
VPGRQRVQKLRAGPAAAVCGIQARGEREQEQQPSLWLWLWLWLSLYL